MSESSIRVFKLESEQSAFDLLSDLLDGRVDADTMQIDFSSATWAKFDLTGEQYHSTINADLTRALVEYQNTLYRVAAYVKGGKLNANAIDEFSREKLRLNIAVSGGSSEFSAEVVDAIGALTSKVTEGMGPKAKFVTTLGAMLMLFGAVTLPAWMEHHYHAIENEGQSEQHKSDMAIVQQAMQSQTEITRQALANQMTLSKAVAEQPQLAEIQKQAQNAVSEIIRQSADADSVRFQSVHIPGPAVRILTGTKRRAGEDVTVEGTFIIEAADFQNADGFIWKVKRVVMA
jgi:hypothetical protein